jgi:hypothetical protein
MTAMTAYPFDRRVRHRLRPPDAGALADHRPRPIRAVTASRLPRRPIEPVTSHAPRRISSTSASACRRLAEPRLFDDRRDLPGNGTGKIGRRTDRRPAVRVATTTVTVGP